jgi:hypothetical protein
MVGTAQARLCPPYGVIFNSIICRHTTAFSRHDASEFCQIMPPYEIRGRREDRVLSAPAASCAK